MRRSVAKAALPLLLITALLASPACIFDPKEDPVIPPPVEIDWPDMTSEDDVIKTILLCYKYPKDTDAVSKYNALLHSDYFFGFADGDVDPGESPIMTRAQDIGSTERIFDAQTMLELNIEPEIGSWYDYTEIGGEPCEDCRATQPSYFIRAQFDDETKIFQSPVGKAEVMVIVSPDEADPTKWVLRAMYDLCVVQ